jgi:anti-sigma factor RsiW
MSTERYIELIHGEIDGVNTPAESAELRKIVENEGAAKDFQEYMKRLAVALDRVEEAEAPEDLREAIRSRIEPRSTAPAALPLRKGVFSAAPGFRIAAALAAGLVLGLFVGPRVFNDDSLNPADVAGSMLPAAAAPVAAPVEIEHEIVQGTVEAVREKDRIVVSYDLSSSQPVELALDDGRYRVSGSGRISGTITLDGADSGVAKVRLEVSSGEISLGAGILRLEAVR